MLFGRSRARTISRARLWYATGRETLPYTISSIEPADVSVRARVSAVAAVASSSTSASASSVPAFTNGVRNPPAITARRIRLTVPNDRLVELRQRVCGDLQGERGDDRAARDAGPRGEPRRDAAVER